MKRLLALSLCLVLVFGLFTGTAGAKTLDFDKELNGIPFATLQGETPVEAEEVLSVSQDDMFAFTAAAFTLGEETYYMGFRESGADMPGLGRFAGELAPEETIWWGMSVGFFTSPNNGGDEQEIAEYLPVDEDTLATIYEALDGDLTITVSPVECLYNDGTNYPAPTYHPEILSEDPTNWLKPFMMLMTLKQAGYWQLTISGSINGEELSVIDYFIFTPQPAMAESFSSVEALNTWLAEECPVDTEMICKLTLEAGVHAGQIVIPEAIGYTTIHIYGAEEGTTLHGGIVAEGGFGNYVANLKLVGAGKDEKTWKGSDYEAENGRTTDNFAMVGISSAENCTIMNYYHGIDCTGSRGWYTALFSCLFMDNSTAVAYNNESANGGNGNLVHNIFANNDLALDFEAINSSEIPMTFFHIRDNNFLNNELDVVNKEKRRVYLPGNYFGYLTEDGALEAREIQYQRTADEQKWVSAYPQLASPAAVMQTFALRRSGGPTYLFDLEEDPMISVDYAADFPIPAGHLPGKVITLMKADEELAVLDFTDCPATDSAEVFEPDIQVEWAEDGLSCEVWLDIPADLEPVVQIPGGEDWYESDDAEIADGYLSFLADGSGYYELRCSKTVEQAEKEQALQDTLPILGGLAGFGSLGGLDADQAFADVASTAWYYEDVAWACRAGLMTGTGNSRFSPDLATSRAMIVTILWRLEGQPMDAETSRFTDVDRGSWYGYAVDWAAAFGIVEGYSDTVFAPHDPITREQLAAILYRYAKHRGYDVWSSQTGLQSFGDADRVSDWAAEAMQWAVGAGIITGANEQLMPQGQATRAQTAAMLHRLFG